MFFRRESLDELPLAFGRVRVFFSTHHCAYGRLEALYTILMGVVSNEAEKYSKTNGEELIPRSNFVLQKNRVLSRLSKVVFPKKELLNIARF